MAKFAINASGAMFLPSLVHVSESISGSVVPLAMFGLYLIWNIKLSSINFFRYDLDASLLTSRPGDLEQKQPPDNSDHPAKGVDGGFHVQANHILWY